MRAQKILPPLVSHWLCAVAMLGCSSLASAQAPAPDELALTEKDFLGEMPIVLSVSRLPQRLDDTPGAVTLIDRHMIRLTGARDVADLLRLVPGFQTSSSFESVAPLASYHGGFDSYSNRIQVLVDGRSAYSPYFIGSVGPGLQTVALEDIERIEVLRGSNSAAYGARAFLGVINIVTRDTVDTLGLQASLASGENAIRDSQARIGWGKDGATFRLSADRRADGGLTGSNGHNQISRVNFRADLRANATDDVQLRAGRLAIEAGKGFFENVDNPQRESTFDSAYAQLDWRRTVDENQDLALSFSHAQEYYRDNFPFSLVPLGINGSVDIDASGRASNDNLTLQHTFRHGMNFRLVWGGEFRHEEVTSKPLYNTDAALVTDFTRLFGNAEWRFAGNLVLNAGAMAEKSSVSGDTFAPRLMLNWHVADGQTLRAGLSQAYRPPSAYETSANVRYVFNGRLLKLATLASGNVQPERVLARELGYLGNFPTLGLNLDVRAFQEDIAGFLRQKNDNPAVPKDYANDEDFSIEGIEYQFKWRPWRDAQLIVNQAYTSINSKDSASVLAAPKLASALIFLQKLPGGLDLSLMHQDSGTVAAQGGGRQSAAAMTRTDLRLAVPLRFGANRGELALVVQNLGLPYVDFDTPFHFERRAFVTLRVEN